MVEHPELMTFAAPLAIEIVMAARMEKKCPIRQETDEGIVEVTFKSTGLTLEIHSYALWLKNFAAVAVSHEDITNEISTVLSESLKTKVRVVTWWKTGSVSVEVRSDYA